MRITEAAQRLGTSPRMLRYRDLLGLLPPVREPASGRRGVTPASGRGGSPPAPGDGGVTLASGRRGSPPAPGHGGVTLASGRRGSGFTPAPGHGGVTQAPGRSAQHRQFGEDDLVAVSLALGIEQRYDVSPAALAFGLRVLTEPSVRAEVAELGRRIGRIRPLPARALEFEKERALRLLSLASSPTRAGGSRRSARRSTRP
jgi:MerR family transcriptional regulator, copper efflux regulator